MPKIACPTGRFAGVFFLALAARAFAAHPDLPEPDFGFRSFCVTWGGTTNAVFEQFLREVRPEIVQCGFYGPMFHGYADDPKSTGYPMQLPVSGQREALAVQRAVNDRIHRLGLKVVGHFQMVNVIADPGQTNGFFAFYDKGWPEDWLGPRPHPDVRELLMRDAGGNVLSNRHYVTYAGLCWNSPHARALLKSMLKLAVGTGLDGVMVNYNYRWNCACPYCAADFRRWLGDHYSAAELRARFGIADLPAHRFETIEGAIPGYPATNAAPLAREAARWAAVAYKRAFDEIFIQYGRSLKKNLIVATWNHLGDISISEERAFLPLELWGRGENYFWYSGGYGPTKLAEGKLGDGWLDCLYVRELGGGKPFMLGKYEPVRMRNSVAEGLATGGSGMGLYMNIAVPEGYKALAEYLRFPRRYPELFDGMDPAADCALVWPREAVQGGDRQAAGLFRDVGRLLSERHLVFEVLADGRADSNRLARYRTVIVPEMEKMPASLRAALDARRQAGGLVLTVADTNALAALPETGCGVDAPWTVKAMLWRGKGRLALHLVNYNRDEEKAAALPKNPAAECPVPADNIACLLELPPRSSVSGVRYFTPESGKPAALPFEAREGSVRFRVPRVEVYGVVEIRGKGL